LAGLRLWSGGEGAIIIETDYLAVCGLRNMTIHITDPETDRLARELAELMGTSITAAVRAAVKNELNRERRKRGMPAIK
jgi:antitoxin VapB